MFVLGPACRTTLAVQLVASGIDSAVVATTLASCQQQGPQSPSGLECALVSNCHLPESASGQFVKHIHPKAWPGRGRLREGHRAVGSGRPACAALLAFLPSCSFCSLLWNYVHVYSSRGPRNSEKLVGYRFLTLPRITASQLGLIGKGG